MNLLSAENISMSYNDKILFKDLNFGVSQGEKIAVVGINGAGKSTLLKILFGETMPDTGKVSCRRGIQMAFLEQNPTFPDGKTVWQCLFDAENEKLNLIRDYEKMIEDGETEGEKFERLLEKMDMQNVWEAEAKIKEIAGKLEIYDFNLPVSSLSGGQKKRVALAKALLSEPDLLILDEPTNHLDLSAIEWLENRLKSQNLSIILVTHDRYFLDNVTNVIAELEEGKIYKHIGNYAKFLENKSVREAVEGVERQKAQNLMRKELDWIRRQPKARGTKAKYRTEAFYQLEDKLSDKKDNTELQINLGMNRIGKKVLECKDVCFSYTGKTILKDFTYAFTREDRIGIAGKNGVGKSTFLNLLTGKIAPDTGSVEKGENTHFGYYTQDSFLFDDSRRVIDVLKDIAENFVLKDGSQLSVSQLLTQFYFPPQKQYDLVGKLSGGEKRRLQLLRVLVERPNFLILDEPTNDLDIQTLNVLEEFLEFYPACLIIVSHDRYFMDRLTERLFIFEGEGKIREFSGNYTDYREYVAENDQNAARIQEKKTPAVAEKVEKTKEKKSLSFKEKQEYEDLEKQIAAAEAKKVQLAEQLNGETDFTKISLVSGQIQALTKEIDKNTDRWLELSLSV